MASRRWLRTLWALPVLAAAVLVAARFDAFAGRPPATLGVRDGRLAPPSATPNSVSSQAGLWAGHPMREAAQVAPLPMRGDAAPTLQRLERVIAGMPGAEIVERRPDYLHVQFTTRWMRFVDDAEFLVEPAAGVVQVRSASRLGRRDFGVNRARVEAIRTALAGAP